MMRSRGEDEDSGADEGRAAGMRAGRATYICRRVSSASVALFHR